MCDEKTMSINSCLCSFESTDDGYVAALLVEEGATDIDVG